MSATDRRGPRAPRRERLTKQQSAQAPLSSPEEGAQLAQLFFANATMAFALVSPDLRFLKVNAALCELVRRPEVELLGAPATLVLPPEDGTSDGVVERMLADPGGRLTVERRLLCGDGAEIWARLELRVIRDARGTPLFYAGTAQDVSREKAALEQVDRERDELAEAEAIAQVGSWRLRLATGEASCSTELRRIFEVPDGAPLDPELFLARVSEPERELVRRRLLRARDHPEPFDWEHRIVRGDGSEGYVHWRAHLVEHGGERWLVGTVQDVSEQKQAERAAAEATERFVTAFEDAPIGMSIVGTDGTYLQVNPALCAMLGYSREQLLDHTFDSFTHPDDVEANAAMIGELVSGERELARYEKRFLHADGHAVWATVAASLVRDEAGEPLYLVAQVEDVSERKRAEQAAREASERFVAGFENAPIGMALVGPDFGILHVNPALCEILGRSREQLEQLDFDALTHPDDRELSSRSLARLMQSDLRAHTYEKRYLHADGHVIWARVASSMVRDADGEPLYYVTQIEDISERKQAEQALAEATERFRNAFENAPIGMALGSLDGAILDANPALCAMSGYTCEQLTQMRWQDVCDPEAVERGARALADLAAGRARSYQVDWRFLRADGSFAWTATSVSVVRGAAGEPLYFVVQMDDVTERREVARSAAEAAERFRGAFENSPIGMALAGPDARWLQVNQALCAMLGYSREELLETTFQEVTHPDDREVSLQQMQRLLTGETAASQFEKRYLRKDGDVVWVIVSTSLVRDAEGEPLYFVSQMVDVSERLRAERALAEAMELFAQAFENAPVGMALTRMRGELLKVNQSLCDMLGYEREQLLTRTLLDITHPDDVDLSHREFGALYAGETASCRFEKRYLHADGGEVWALISASVISDEHGEPDYLVVQALDVTERRRAERALAEARERFARAFENAPAGVALAAPGCKLLDVNPALCEMLGYTRGQLLRMSLRELTHPDDVEATVRELGRAYAGEIETCRLEKRYMHADGHPVWVLFVASAVRDEKGDVLYAVAQIVDIGERRRLEELLRANAALLEEAQQLAHVGSFELELASGEAIWSPELYRIHGLDPEGPPPTRDLFIESVHPEDRERIAAVVGRAEPAGLEFRIVRPDGSVRHVVSHAQLTRAADGMPERLTGAVQDVTERVEAEAARLELEARMQEAQRLESLGVLAGGIAHDFNNLLVGVLGNAGLAALELPAHSPARLLIDQIEIAARRAAELTKQMLAYSGRGQFVVQPLDLRAVVREMSALLETVIPKHVVVDYDFAEELPAVRADVAQIRQLVMNLITNAADAIGEAGGRIEISVAERYADAAFLAGYSLSEGLPEGPYVTLDVRDDGAGMDADTLGRIFDPFFTTKFSGHGLGLAAALGIVRGHHGGIRVESARGRGSCFSLVLPAVEDVAERPGLLPEAPAWTGSGTVLVIDDEEIVRRAAGRILSSGGLSVVEAASGPQALELFAQAPDRFDVALVDLVMPGMSGEELVRELRKLRPDLPVVVTSGYDARALVEALGARGEFLQKPYHPRDLLECMRRSTGGA